VQIVRSAFKHGCTAEQIAHAVATGLRRTRLGEDPTRWPYVGVDAAGRHLEIVSLLADDGQEVIIHAMKLRKRYQPKGGRQ